MVRRFKSRHASSNDRRCEDESIVHSIVYLPLNINTNIRFVDNLTVPQRNDTIDNRRRRKRSVKAKFVNSGCSVPSDDDTALQIIVCYSRG